jgi:hypothetical protein
MRSEHYGHTDSVSLYRYGAGPINSPAPKWFQEACPSLNPMKCQLFQMEVQYLGHIASPEGKTINPKKLTVL